MTPPNDDVMTLGEVGRKVDDLATTVKDMAKRVDDRPDWHDVRRIESHWNTKLTAAERRITLLESWQTWAGRLFMGGIVTSIIGAYFVIKS